MPQFEVAPAAGPSTFVRARDPEDAVRRAVSEAAGAAVNAALEIGAPEAGSGWMEVSHDGEVWGRVRPRDRMRFRRD
ncbi:MAG: hypothetical protein AAF845_17060 [Bacteroidota bacterium]